MHYPNEAIIAALKAARSTSGLSQRDLSAKAGVPQSHISKIESGATDIRLSSLIELARALDLELTLVPRRLLPAVEGILRTTPLPTPRKGKHDIRELHQAEKALAKLTRLYPDAPGQDKLRQTLLELGHLRLSANDLALIAKATERLLRIAENRQDASAIPEIQKELQNLCNRIAHGIREPQRPAYSLEEDNDA